MAPTTLLSVALLTNLVRLTFAASPQVVVDLAGTSQILSSYSSLLQNTATSVNPSPTICCGDSCPPGSCDLNAVVPTDMAYIYPPPSSPSSSISATPVSLPCCTNGCADGACRVPTPQLLRRPIQTSPLSPGKQTDIPVVIGCKTPRLCGLALTQGVETGIDTATTDTKTGNAAQVTTAPTAADSLHENGFFNSLAPDVCIGCGVCHPCNAALISTWVSFLPAPSSKHSEGIASSSTTATTPASASATPTTSASTATNTSSPNPTYYLAPEIVQAINGANQDILPIIIQKGTSQQSQLITLLATVELKLSENYISRRLLSHIGLLDKTSPFPPTLPPATAILSPELKNTTINATVVFDLVAGDKDGATQHAFTNVRFQVYGDVGDDRIDLPDVLVGSKLLREAGALTVYHGFRGEVARGVEVVWPGHVGRVELGGVALQKEVVEEGGEGHDEL